MTRARPVSLNQFCVDQQRRVRRKLRAVEARWTKARREAMHADDWGDVDQMIVRGVSHRQGGKLPEME